MTKKDLEKHGIDYIGSKIHPDRFFIQTLGCSVTLDKPYNWDSILRQVYFIGNENGIAFGEAKKIKEIKRVLQIEDDLSYFR